MKKIMKVDPSHIAHIKAAFGEMQSLEDLVNLLNQTKAILYGEKSRPFTLQQFTWHAYPRANAQRYRQFKIKKKSGGERSIHAPVRGLKSIQRILSFVLQCVYQPHDAATGFVQNKSVVDNAKLHAGSRYVYNVDLKDFFPSIDQARVWKCLQNPPFNLKPREFKHILTLKEGKPVFSKDGKHVQGQYGYYYNVKNLETIEASGMLKMSDTHELITSNSYFTKGKCIFFNSGNNGWSKGITNTISKTNYQSNKLNRLTIANAIASICCTELDVERKNEAGEWVFVKRNVLPQGAPTSPVLTNVICQRLDYLLTGVAKRFGLTYSRYADDITFSSMHNVYQPDSEFLKELHRIIAEQNFHIKESKTRLQKDGYRKEVTGLLVNEKVNVQKRYIKQLRMWLYYWERYGYERASEFFLQQYMAEKGHVKKGNPNIANVIAGKLEYLKMVKGEENELYVKLRIRFEALTGSSTKNDNRQQHLNEVLDTLFDKGLDGAMDIYKPIKK